MLIPLLFLAEPLHVVDSSKSTVLYRNGIELVNTNLLIGPAMPISGRCRRLCWS